MNTGYLDIVRLGLGGVRFYGVQLEPVPLPKWQSLSPGHSQKDYRN